MKNTVSKGILYYIFLFLAIIVGVACVIVAIMIFSPGTEIFGISYYINNQKYEIKNIDANDSSSAYISNLISNGSITTLNINTDYANVIIKTTSKNRIYFSVNSSVSGILKDKTKNKYNFSYNYNADDKSFSLEVVSPELFWFFNDTVDVVLVLPEEVVNTNLDVNITTNKGDVEIGNHEDDKYTIKNLNITAKDTSKIILGKHTQIDNNLRINSPKGNIYFKTAITANQIRIDSVSAKIETYDVFVSDTFKIITESSSIKLGNVNGNLDYSSRKGVLIVNNIDGNFTCSEDVVISNITINKITGYVALPNAETSNITISELYGYALIRTTSGNVTIKEAKSIVDITTTNGAIDVMLNSNYDTVIGSYEPAKGTANLTTTNGNITVKFKNIVLKNNIVTEKGKITCEFGKTLNFSLTYDCSRNAPSLSSGIDSGDAKHQASYTFGTASDNALNITNNLGQTSISDTFAG